MRISIRRFRIRGNVLALALGGLAVVIASGGTAVAVANQSVQIVDPTTATHVAHVDLYGQLNVATPTATINTAYFGSVGLTPLTSPTTASIAVTRLAIMNNAGNSTYTGTNFSVSLVKINVDSTGKCYSGSIASSASLVRAPIGSSMESSYDYPLIFNASGTQKYCVGVSIHAENGADPGAYYLPFVQLTGYVRTGAYTPLAVTAPSGARAPLATPADPYPAGAAPRG